MRIHCVLLLGVVAASSAQADPVYRCQIGGKVSYSDRPCAAGDERRIRTDGGPSYEEMARARDRLNREIEARHAVVVAQEQQRQARELERQRQAQLNAQREESRPASTRADDEKVMLHSKYGWDYKARGQIAAEAQASKTGVAPPRTGAAWENDRQLTYAPSGWRRDTGREAVEAAAAAAREPTPMQVDAPHIQPSPQPRSPFIQDNKNQTWIDRGDNWVTNARTNQTCNIVGSAGSGKIVCR